MEYNDARRPSAASATTIGSTGSKSSASRGVGPGYHKRLQNVFGEEFPADSRQGSDTSLPTPYITDTQSMRSMRIRNNSINNPPIGTHFHSRPGSPNESRPRTPLPSSEVTPWEFQDFSHKVGEMIHALHQGGHGEWVHVCLHRLPHLPFSTLRTLGAGANVCMCMYVC